ncbi:hypothetical protein [Candidatus Symbiobacter mobilis]|uniref:Uncharacterized protein n=1 Tax=Candidatus Symbiobacter mobilis CR TaxID=946483 RepID=U5N4H9_9BURK|nr:hypothetical protein [Candidatus Symbiobacter mobilis]AGX86366.1 hypothetical protein Cenrod_0239 [Candidatus Symbiobacter mobilis CR]
MINEAGLSEAELEAQHKRRDFIILQRDALTKARKDGEEEGRLAERHAVIFNAHRNGLPPQLITSLVGLSEAEVTRLLQRHGI